MDLSYLATAFLNKPKEPKKQVNQKTEIERLIVENKELKTALENQSNEILDKIISKISILDI